MRSPALIGAVSFLATLIAGSTVFFRYVEGWTWIDSYFFTVVTLSTVGYGNLVPETAIGKVATTVLIFAGIGAFAFAIQQFGSYFMQREAHRQGWLYRHLPHAETDTKDHDKKDGDQTGGDKKDGDKT
ncbi:MAG: potassium channel family protein [Pseudomonadota bacterium]